MSKTENSIRTSLLWFVFGFLLVGEILLFSATGVMGLQRYGSEFYFLTRQTVIVVLGLFLMIGLSRVSYSFLRKFALPLIWIQVAITVLTLVGPFTHQAQGASRWLSIQGFRFQPGEFAKITVPIYFCHLVARSRERSFSWQTWAITAIPLLLLAGTLYRQPDLGTIVILVIVVFGVLFYAGLSIKTAALFVLSGGGFLTLALATSAYRRRRFLSFLNPWNDPLGSGFQVIQSFISFHWGSLFGVGIGNGNSKLYYLPEVHTDFIFALVGEELGFVGATALLLAFAIFTYLLFKGVSRAKDSFGCYLGAALATALVLQILVNLGGVTGLLPVKGLTLPFISWGRSSLIANLAMMGILLNIIQQSEIIPGKQSQEAVPRVQK